MTRVEAIEWAVRAGGMWHFKSYYKYRFTFTTGGGMVSLGEGITLTASVGGNAADIYRFEVQDPMTWDEICSAGEPVLRVTDLEGNVIYDG